MNRRQVQAIQRRIDALTNAMRVRGEVYWEGERNIKLGKIHSTGAILRQGASTALRTVEASDVTTGETRRAIVYTRSGRASVDRRASGGPGVIVPRNPFFVQPGDAARAQRILRNGVNAIVRGRSTSLEPAMEEAAATIAKGMQRNIAPDGRLASSHVGYHSPELIGEGRKMDRLTPAYAARKERKHGPRPILVATGELRESVRSRVVKLP